MDSEFIFLTEGDLREIANTIFTLAVQFGKNSSSRPIENINEAAPEMYSLIQDLARVEQPAEYIQRFLRLKTKARKLLARIEGTQEVQS